MKDRNTYPNIDMEKTGMKLKNMLSNSGYTPNMIKDYLHLSCVQPIYRWYKGKILPSVDHLLKLSELLDVHMEELLVKKNSVILEQDIVVYKKESLNKEETYNRLTIYYRKIEQLVA